MGLGTQFYVVVGDVPFAVLLPDDFLTDYKPGVTADLANASKTGKSQLSVMQPMKPIFQNTVLWCRTFPALLCSVENQARRHQTSPNRRQFYCLKPLQPAG